MTKEIRKINNLRENHRRLSQFIIIKLIKSIEMWWINECSNKQYLLWFTNEWSVFNSQMGRFNPSELFSYFVIFSPIYCKTMWSSNKIAWTWNYNIYEEMRVTSRIYLFIIVIRDVIGCFAKKIWYVFVNARHHGAISITFFLR